jgi:epsilon-lactone hydrolase
MAATYEFRVCGHLGPTLLQAFPDLEAEMRGKFTLLRGIVRDQAALHGVLARLEALGLKLVDMRQLTND